MKCRGRLAAIALSLAVSFTAAAFEFPTGDQPTRVDVTSTTVGAWHGDNNDGKFCDDFYGSGLERLNLNASRGGFSAGLRLDGSLFINKPKENPSLPRPCYAPDLNSRYLNTVVPEKVWLGWAGRHFEVTAGDSYASFGRGLSLSLRKTDELGVDTTARGLRLKAQNDTFSGTLVAGLTNINNLDEASGRFAPDPNDLVLGAEADALVFDRLRIGAHAAGFAFHDPKSTSAPLGQDLYRETWVTFGPTLDAPRLTENFGFYLEGLGQRRTTVEGVTTTGYGLYGTATAHAGAAAVLLEGKAYGDLEVVQPSFVVPTAPGSTRGQPLLEFLPVQYTTLPTAERLLQPVKHPQAKVAGARLRFDWTFSPDLNVFANYGLFRDDYGYTDPESLETKPGIINDPYAGVDWRAGALRVQAEAGWRWVQLRQSPEPVMADGHFDASAAYGFGAHSIDLHLTDWERTDRGTFVTRVWREGAAQLSYRLRPYFAVAGILDYSTEPGLPQVLYPGGTFEWDFSSSSTVRVFAGSSRGGLRCISGICKVFPPFQGVKATVTVRL